MEADFIFETHTKGARIYLFTGIGTTGISDQIPARTAADGCTKFNTIWGRGTRFGPLDPRPCECVY